MTLYESLKAILLLLIFAYVAPHLVEGIKNYYKPIVEQQTNIGIICIKKNLYDSFLCIKHLNVLFKNPSIKGIILSIDCYNCSAGTSNAIFNEIQQLKREYPKPIITLVENTCISGAYLIASACDYIIAPESALIGGVGVYNIPAQLPSLLHEHAINYIAQHHITENSELLNNTKKPLEIPDHMTKSVATARKLSLATASNWANQKIFTTKQALSLGLINAIGSLHTVSAILKEKGLVDSEIVLIEKNAHQTESSLTSDLAMSVQYCNIVKSIGNSLSMV